jgi:hypothetical protein
MERFDKIAEDIYTYLTDDDRREAMTTLNEILRMDQDIRWRLTQAKKKRRYRK